MPVPCHEKMDPFGPVRLRFGASGNIVHIYQKENVNAAYVNLSFLLQGMFAEPLELQCSQVVFYSIFKFFFRAP